MDLYAPNDPLIGSSASESVVLPDPALGSYTVVLEGYLSTPTDYTGTAEIDSVLQ